jgi:hypothetical protein
MSTTLSNAGRPASLRQAAWVLGVPLSAVHRAVRVGDLRVARLRSRLVVDQAELVRVLGGAR